LREGALELVGDHPPHLHRLDEVGVVVAVAQHIGADQDAPLGLGAEALGARLLDHVDQVVVLGGAVAIAHAVEARQVAARLRRGDDVVHRDAELGIGQADLDQLRAHPLVLAQRSAHRALDVGLQAVAEELLRHADLQAAHIGVEVACEVLARRSRLVESFVDTPACC
jgi:hypothetical protein